MYGGLAARGRLVAGLLLFGTVRAGFS